MVVGCLAKRRRAQERRAAVSTPTLGRDRPVVLITGADLAPEALALLHDYQLAYAGKTPTEQSIIELCRERSEEHTSELQSLMRISYAVFCLKKKIQN